MVKVVLGMNLRQNRTRRRPQRMNERAAGVLLARAGRRRHHRVIVSQDLRLAAGYVQGLIIQLNRDALSGRALGGRELVHSPGPGGGLAAQNPPEARLPAGFDLRGHRQALGAFDLFEADLLRTEGLTKADAHRRIVSLGLACFNRNSCR